MRVKWLDRAKTRADDAYQHAEAVWGRYGPKLFNNWIV